jgi:hypothetical protein
MRRAALFVLSYPFFQGERMSKPNLKSQAKRKRELAKLGKRQAKDEKRALKKAEQRTGPEVPVVAPVVAAAPAPAKPKSALAAILAGQPVITAPVAAKPLTLEAAVERWKNSKIGAAKPRR